MRGFSTSSNLMVREIADRGQGLAVRGDHVDRVPDRVARGGDGLDARQEFLLLSLTNTSAVAIGQQVLAGALHEQPS